MSDEMGLLHAVGVIGEARRTQGNQQTVLRDASRFCNIRRWSARDIGYRC